MEEINTKTIIDEDLYGNGIIKENNFVIFVSKALKGETVKYKISNKHKRFAKAYITDLITQVDKRCPVNCSAYFKCGSCQYLHLNNEDEKTKKINIINQLFPDVSLDKVIFNEFSPRNKVTLHVKNNKIGYYEEETNNIIEFNYCELLSKKMNEIIAELKNNDLNGINKIVIRETYFTKQIMVCFYGNKYIPLEVNSIYLNDNLIKGRKEIIEEINKLKYVITPTSFFQTNSLKMISLYDTIKEYAGKGNELLDLYCGSATIGIYLSNNFLNITGVEISKENIKNAYDNIKLNNISNLKLILGDSKLINKGSYDMVIIDPPRNGLSKEVINNLVKFNKLIYVSCNPQTLKRDLEKLSEFKIEKFSIIDMFPKTNNIECVVLLTKKVSNENI